MTQKHNAGTVQRYYKNANGVEHHICQWGDDDNPTILTLHGYLDCGESFFMFAERLVAAGFRVIAPDLRGHGKTGATPPGSYYHFYNYVRDVEQLVITLDLNDFHLIAHSMGGTIATLFASVSDVTIRSLTLVEGLGPEDAIDQSPVERLKTWLTTTQKALARQDVPMTRDSAIKRLQTQHAHIPADVLHRLLPILAQSIEIDSEERWHWRFDPLHRSRAPTRFSSADYIRHASMVKIPTLIVSGQNGFHPQDEKDRLQAFINAKQVSLGQVGHMMHWQCPEGLGRHVA